ncbi:hypothetical protein C6P40_004388 [Pichia californica]|uniref:Uncharacterized protein n=1 Tax=Pichia californica TaxID=460514 RepID=A0A9P6WMR0_9ASCO|nr:hypothetical protein C6P42_005098 [[Candida] californica]KAG0689819.1 hypothetical protein C6P40_004388 [[Candida] californica]
MTVFTTVINPADIHDTRYHNPSKISPTIQYQLPPTSYFTLYHIQQYINDLLLLPYNIHSNSIISFSISNTSLSSYKNSRLLKQHLDILWDNCKIQRLDLDFTQFKFRDGILQRVFAMINHIQKHGNYNIFLSITLPVDKNLMIPEEFIGLLLSFKEEFININMLNILIKKDLKRKNLSWLDITKLVYKNIILQLINYDSTKEIFIGSIEKYIGFLFDCDINISLSNYDIKNLNHLQSSQIQNDEQNQKSLHHSHSHSFLKHNVKTTVKQSVIHGEKRNMNELGFLQIWKWANDKNIGQIQFKSYLTNSKNIKNIIEKNINALSYNPNNNLSNNKLILPHDFLFKLADEVGIKNIIKGNNQSDPVTYYFSQSSSSSRSGSTSSSSDDDDSIDTLNTYDSKNNNHNNHNNNNYNNTYHNPVTIINDSNTIDPGLPDYETVMLQKVIEHERMMNALVKLPSYRINK